MGPALAAIPAAIGLAAQIGGSSALGMFESKRDKKDSYQRSRDFRGTAYLDTMADMKAAGLNPILAGKLGGSSAPVISGSPKSNPASTIQASTARKLAEEQTNLMWTQRMNTSADTDKKRMETYNLERQKEFLEEQVNSAKMHNDILRSIIPYKTMLNEFKGHENMKPIYQIGEMFRALNPFLNSATSINNMGRK